MSICEVKPAILQTEVHPSPQEKAPKEHLASEGMAIQAWHPPGHGDRALIAESIFTELTHKYNKSRFKRELITSNLFSDTCNM